MTITQTADGAVQFGGAVPTPSAPTAVEHLVKAPAGSAALRRAVVPAGEAGPRPSPASFAQLTAPTARTQICPGCHEQTWWLGGSWKHAETLPVIIGVAGYDVGAA